jgi:amidohydrolase
MKDLILASVDNLRDELIELSHNIHTHPETSFQERQAVAFQKEILERHGFTFEPSFCGLETAYRATFQLRADHKREKDSSAMDLGPCIAFLAEYDALEGIGHACGHNIIAASAVGAGVALSKLNGLSGEVLVIGTPAEERGGGKVLLVEQGAFENVDFVMMMHPEFRNIYGRGGIAATHIRVEFNGKSSHAVEPGKGINALIPLLEFFNGLNALRQNWPHGHVITGIITNGGQAPNVIPGHTEALFVPRAPTCDGLKGMLADLERLASACASITGASAQMHTAVIYAERYPNITLGERFRDNMAQLGVSMMIADETVAQGSSDIGNVSMVVPTIHEYLAIVDGATTHSNAFREAATSPRGDEVILLAAKGMAMTACDLLTDVTLRDAVRKEFETKVPKRF